MYITEEFINDIRVASQSPMYTDYRGLIDKFEALLVKVRQDAVEETLRSIPMVVGSIMRQASGVKELQKKFLADNPEYVKHPQLIVQLIEQVETANPGWSYPEVLSEVKIRADKAIQITINPEVKPKFTLPELDNRLKGL